MDPGVSEGAAPAGPAATAAQPVVAVRDLWLTYRAGRSGAEREAGRGDSAEACGRRVTAAGSRRVAEAAGRNGRGAVALGSSPFASSRVFPRSG